MDNIILKFNKKNEAQIAKRFETMYNLLSEKTWIKRYEAQDAHGNEVDAKAAAATSFCLIGAVRYINGPTEEEIVALLCLAIAKKDDILENLIDSYVEEHNDYPEYTPSRLEALFGVYNDIVTGTYNYSNECLIPEFNDDENTTLVDVKKVIKDAKNLYPKMKKLYEKYHTNIVKINKLKKEMDNFNL